MNITLTRLYSRDDCTIGVLTSPEKMLCFTMENPWRHNQKNVSCIPEGKYRCEPHAGTKHKETWIVKDVDGRSGIVFHIGNTESDTRGCILPGTTVGMIEENKAVLRSRIALEKLRVYIGLNTSFNLIVKRV